MPTAETIHEQTASSAPARGAAEGLTRAQKRTIRTCVPFMFRDVEAGWEWRSEVSGLLVAVYAGEEKNTVVVSVLDLEAGQAIELWKTTIRLTGSWRRRVRQLSGEALILAQTRPACPKCGKPMKLRRAHDEGNQFFGCSQYPKCRGLLNIIEGDVEHV